MTEAPRSAAWYFEVDSECCHRRNGETEVGRHDNFGSDLSRLRGCVTERAQREISSQSSSLLLANVISSVSHAPGRKLTSTTLPLSSHSIFRTFVGAHTSRP
jgi:hypothetical protein